jgi:hypothetical protein
MEFETWVKKEEGKKELAFQECVTADLINK